VGKKRNIYIQRENKDIKGEKEKMIREKKRLGTRRN